MTAPPAGAGPIFIQGILWRSGTNYLHDLLCAHPDCQPAGLHENFFVSELPLLLAYARAVASHWNPEWPQDAGQLSRQLGASLEAFLGQPASGQRIVTKTPSVANLRHFSQFFPDAALIILVRDGRAVVESGVRSFGWDYETAMRRWAEAGQTILDVQATGVQPLHLVRFEDLFIEPRATLTRIFAFANLDAARYNFDAAEQAPVRGSSELRGGGGQLHWNSTHRPADFNPLARWQDWPRARHERFNALAGPVASRLGYTLDQPPASAPARLYWRTWNWTLDTGWRMRAFGRRVRAAAARRLGRAAPR